MMLSAMSTIINILSIVWLRLTIFASYFRLSSSKRVADLSLKGEGLGSEDYGKVSSLRIRGRKVALFITGKYKSAQILTAFIVANLHLPSSRKVPEVVSVAWTDVERADQALPVPMKELAAARIGYFYPASTHEVAKTSTKYANVKQESAIFTEQDAHPTEADEQPASIVKITPAVSGPIQDTDQAESFTSNSGLLPLNPPLVRSSLSRLAYPESQDVPLATIDSIVNAPQPGAVDPRPRRLRSAAFKPAVFTVVPKLRTHALAVLERKKLAASMDNGSAFFEETHGEDNLSATAHFPVSFPAEDPQETTEALNEDIPTETIAPTSITLEDIQGPIAIDNISSESADTGTLDLSEFEDDVAIPAEEDDDEYDIRRWLAHASETSIDGVTHVLGSDSDDDCDDDDDDDDITDDDPAVDSGRRMSPLRFLSSSAYLPSLDVDHTVDPDHLRSIYSTYQDSSEDEDADDEGDDIDNVSEYSELDAMECGDFVEATSAHPSPYPDNGIHDDQDSGLRMTSPSVCSSPSSELDMDGVLGCDDPASVCLEPHLTMREIPSLSFNAQGNATHEWDPSPILDYTSGPPSSPTGSCSSYSSGSSASSISPPPTPTFTQFACPRFAERLPEFATSPRPSLASRLSVACQSPKVALPHGTPSLVKATKPQARNIFAGFRSRLSNIHWTDFIPDDDSDDESGDEDHEWVPPTREWPFNEPEDVRPQADIFIVGDCSDEE